MSYHFTPLHLPAPPCSPSTPSTAAAQCLFSFTEQGREKGEVGEEKEGRVGEEGGGRFVLKHHATTSLHCGEHNKVCVKMQACPKPSHPSHSRHASQPSHAMPCKCSMCNFYINYIQVVREMIGGQRSLERDGGAERGEERAQLPKGKEKVPHCQPCQPAPTSQ